MGGCRLITPGDLSLGRVRSCWMSPSNVICNSLLFPATVSMHKIILLYAYWKQNAFLVLSLAWQPIQNYQKAPDVFKLNIQLMVLCLPTPLFFNNHVFILQDLLTFKLFQYNQSAHVRLQWQTDEHPRLDGVKTLWYSPWLVICFVNHPVAVSRVWVRLAHCLAKVQQRLSWGRIWQVKACNIRVNGES